MAREKSTNFFILFVLNALNFVLNVRKFAKIAVFKLFVQKSEKSFWLKITPLPGKFPNDVMVETVRFLSNTLKHLLAPSALAVVKRIF